MTSGHSGRVVNAAATLTRLGGSRMTPATVSAMGEAAQSYVDLPRAALDAGEHLARLTGNEAAMVTAGASAAITLVTASLVTGLDPVDLEVFPQLDGFVRTEMIMVTGQRNAYDYAVRLTGVTIVECEPSAGQPHSRAYLRVVGDHDAATIADRPWRRDPRVAVLVVADDTIALNPQTVTGDEVDLVIDAVRAVLADRR